MSLSVRVCPDCGQTNPSTSTFCANCAAALSSVTPTAIPSPKPAAFKTPRHIRDPDTDTRLFQKGSPELFCAFFAAIAALVFAGFVVVMVFG